MNNIIKRVWNQNRMVNIEDLRGMAFQAESGGHTFEISGINDAGESVPLSGTVSGVFMRPDNADIAIVGTATGGVVSVTLPADCYAVSGRFALTIFVTSNSQKVAVYAAVGTVTRTSGGAVAGDTPQDVVDLINAINAAVATIPADYTALMAAVAPTYSSSALYAVGQYAWHSGNLYRCVVPITTAETFTTAHWESASIGNDLWVVNAALTVNTQINLAWERGNINNSGANANSSRYVRTAEQVAVTDTPLYITFDGSYSTDSYYNVYIYDSSGTFQSRTKKTASAVFMPTIGQKFRILIAVGSNDTTTVIPVMDANNILQASVKIRRDLDTDRTLTLKDRPADAKAVGDALGIIDNVLVSHFASSELENGKYNVASAGTGSSSASCAVNGDVYDVLGVRSKKDINDGYINNVDMLVSHGSVYMYAIGVDTATDDVLGYYNNGVWSRSQNNIAVSQLINIRSIIAGNPTVRLKLCIVDISTTAQISAADVVNAVDVYYVPSREQIGSMSNELEFINPKVPSYYDNMLATKEASILANMETTGRHGFTFAFLTDLHWDNNAKNSPVLLHHIMEKVGLTDVICGGDLIAEGTREYAEGLILDCIDTFKRFGITFPVAYGNHDGNWNPYNNQREHPERRLDESAVWALMESQFDKYAPVYYTDTGFNFYIDYPVTDTRLIFVDTGDTRDVGGSTGIFFTEWESYADALMAAGNKNIIVISHAVAVNSIGKHLCKIANSYNARAEHHSDVLDYDFTDAQGHVYVVIGGHGHSDAITTPTSGGISWVMTDTDSTNTNSTGGATVGTTTEQAFDVVTVDYTTGGIRLVRIGRGEDRNIGWQ